MATSKSLFIYGIVLFAALISCKKGTDAIGERPKDPMKEPAGEVLLPNEIREKEGIRFILTWSVYDSSKAQDYAQFDLKLFKGTGLAKSATPIALIPAPHEFINYSVLTSSLEDDGDYTLEIGYSSISKNGFFDLSVIGYTATASTKRFTISSTPFTVSNANSKQDFLKLKKEGSKYSFYKL